MYLLILAAIVLMPIVVEAATVALVLVRIDCCDGVCVMGLKVRGGAKKWPASPRLFGQRSPALRWTGATLANHRISWHCNTSW